ncbi:MAG TPA: substrate-binding domain-containing protein [Steroidobacteraceae bacterium]|nr:substrate-binding domain-containing protein [Steroidobacteraceae bacterium]
MAVKKTNLTSMDDIARLANVAKSTVSRAFKDSPLLNPATKARILAIARRHGYSVNANAQKLRTNRSNTVAVVMHLPPHAQDSAAAPFFFQLLNDVAQGLWVRRQDLLLCPPEPDDTHHYESMISSKRADGIIFLGQGPGDKWLKGLARTGVPFVVWGAADERATYCTVGSDNRRGGQLAGQRFLKLHRERIMFVGNRAHPEMEQRRQGLAAALTHGPHSAEITDLDIPDFTFETGYAAMIGHLMHDGHARPGALRPDGIFAGSDSVAMGAIIALQEAGLRVPDEVSVIGYNDLPPARHFQLPLTTIRQDTHQAGSLLVEKLFQRLDGGRPSSAKVPTELIVRQT